MDEKQVKLVVTSGRNGNDMIEWPWQQETSNPLGPAYMPHR